MHPQCVRACQPKGHEEKRERERQRQRDSLPVGERETETEKQAPGPLAPLFIWFFPPPGPALCKLG